jgi:hypothetical protein
MKVLQTSACDDVSSDKPKTSSRIEKRQSLTLPYSSQNQADLATRIANLPEEARKALLALIDVAENASDSES